MYDMRDGESFLDWFSRVCNQEIESRDDRNYAMNEAQAEKFWKVLSFLESEVKRQGGKLDSVNLIPREEDAGVTALFPRFSLEGNRVREFCDSIRGMSAFGMDSTLDREVSVDCTIPDVFVARGFSPEIEDFYADEDEENTLEDWEFDEWIAQLPDYCEDIEGILSAGNWEINKSQMRKLAELVRFFESEADEQGFAIEEIEFSPNDGSATITVSFTVLDLYMQKIPAFCDATEGISELSAYSPESGEVLLSCKLPWVLQKKSRADS